MTLQQKWDKLMQKTRKSAAYKDAVIATQQEIIEALKYEIVELRQEIERLKGDRL